MNNARIEEAIKEVVKDTISSEAASIRRIIKNGRLYGEPVDANDTDSLIVAAYFYGLEKSRENWKIFNE